MNLDDLKEHGGPAFPTHRLQWDYGSEDRELATKHCGMSLRDYFAGQALQGLLAGCPDDKAMRLEMNPQLWALASYNMADAMLAARGEA